MKAIWYLILGLLLATGQTCKAADTGWQWVRIAPSSTPEGWEVLQGTTDVKIVGRNLIATLVYERPGLSYGFNLSGTISGNTVVAKEVRRESDMEPVHYQGTIRNETDAAGTKGAARIVLRHGPWFIGLYRSPP
jgi:hypothetical protein